MHKLKPLALALLFSVSMGTLAQAKYYIWFNEPSFWGDDPWINDPWIEEFYHRSMSRMQDEMIHFGPKAEDREAFKAAGKNLAKITDEIKEDDSMMSFTLSGLEGITKDDIKVIKQKNGNWAGTITTKDGRIEFILSPCGIQISRQAEVKKEDDKKSASYLTSSMTSEGQRFKKGLDLNTVKATFKDNVFTLTAETEKEETLTIE